MKSIVALLGRPDTPTDGVADYCSFLGQALVGQGVELEIRRVRFTEQGWVAALLDLRRTRMRERGEYVLLQYTALGWSRRGFPLGAVITLLLLRLKGTKCGVIFHESRHQSVPRTTWINRIRGSFQECVIRALQRLSLRSIFTVPLHTISWLSETDTKNVFIPLGANIPERVASSASVRGQNDERKAVAVFCVSEPPYRGKELAEISQAMRLAAAVKPGLRVIFLGKGTREAQDDILRRFDGAAVEVTNLGLCELEEVGRVLRECDAMLCVRGKLNPRRASALAGIACGVPIIAYSGAAEGTALAEAGVEFVAEGDADGLGRALVHILTDGAHWQHLHERSVRVHRDHFSWDSIATSLIRFLNEPRPAQ